MILSGNQCQCALCHRVFVGVAAFDAHRAGAASRQCWEPSSLGLWLATDGMWSEERRDLEAIAKRNQEAGRRLHAPRRSSRKGITA